MGSAKETSLEALLGALVELDRDLANDLLIAVSAFTDAERRLIALDQAAGWNVEHRLERLRGLTDVRDPLEHELSV